MLDHGGILGGGKTSFCIVISFTSGGKINYFITHTLELSSTITMSHAGVRDRLWQGVRELRAQRTLNGIVALIMANFRCLHSLI